MTHPDPAAPGDGASSTNSQSGFLSSALQPGVKRRELVSWALFDFANSGYTTVVLTAVFNAYFVGVVAAGLPWATLALTAALSLSYLLVMFSMPVLGAWADARLAKKRLLVASTIGCVLATWALSLAAPGKVFWALAALAVSNYFYCVGEALIAAFLPGLARPQALGRVSGWGWSVGYLGGMLTLGLSLVLVSRGQAAGLSATQYVPWVMWLTGAIFAVAALPSFLWLRERRVSHTSVADVTGPVRPWHMLSALRHAWGETREHYPDMRRLLLCGACYHAGISVVITLAAVYATEVMGFHMAQTMLLIFLVNIGAAAGAFAFGHVQDAIGHKLALAVTLAGWILMVLIASVAVKVWVFWLAATLAGLCMGTSQSAGRAMVGVLAPVGQPAAFYGLWAFAIQLAAVVGPLSYGVMVWLTAGQHRLALLFTGAFFVAGLAVLRQVDFARGQMAAGRPARWAGPKGASQPY